MGNDPVFWEAADLLGKLIVKRGWDLVYGCGSIGLMGVVADSVLAEGGHVIGVIPEFLAKKEVMHEGVSDLRIVRSMHERKALMAELSDAFVALPGGFGTLEEFFEIVTWNQLGIHHKNTGLLNIQGFFDPILAMIDRTIEREFVKESNRELFFADDDPQRLLERLETHEIPQVKKWLTKNES
ncbi:MAG: TIGR00730 family Rossman fold protein [Planctomycetota bacterium]|nr:TIGR00730 family Rossman fold protein [Planctomycetota bacterium]